MQSILIALAVLPSAGIAALLLGGRRAASAVGASGAVAAAVLGIVPALRVLGGGPAESLRLAWDVPWGSFHLELDPLSALFLLPVLGLPALAAIFGTEYLSSWKGRRRLGSSWLWFDLLVASMALVVLARNGVLFLAAWEGMTISSYFLVTLEDEEEEVRKAGWTYLVAAHLGTAPLFALFLLLGGPAGSLDLDRIAAAGVPAPGTASALFLLAVVGFGTKAGFIPLHVWLPEAHPAAPSHVSAVMSGVMIKTGIYGLLRVLGLLGAPPAWWGWTLAGIGISSGVLGILLAIVQRDVKRLLAYHSVGDIGIIAIGLGLGLLGLAAGSAPLAVLGFAGGLFHVVNHSLFKGLLFLGAGAAARAAGTREMDRLGGLLRRMPWTGATFLVGAAAISGLPPFNGFASELLIYLAALGGIGTLDPSWLAPLAGSLAGMALIGGLAGAWFGKAFGIVFLGEPRGAGAAGAREAGLAARASMAILAAGCAAVGILAPAVCRSLAPAVAAVSGLPPESVGKVLGGASRSLESFVLAGGILAAAVAVLIILRWILLARREVRKGLPTWDCGYARPTPRMQYTASSFTGPVAALFAGILRIRTGGHPPRGYFPQAAALRTEIPDVFAAGIWRPAFRGIARALGSLRWLQHGRVQIYVLYIAVTLLVLLVWKLW